MVLPGSGKGGFDIGINASLLLGMMMCMNGAGLIVSIYLKQEGFVLQYSMFYVAYVFVGGKMFVLDRSCILCSLYIPFVCVVSDSSVFVVGSVALLSGWGFGK